jgi:hypothetical protein
METSYIAGCTQKAVTQLLCPLMLQWEGKSLPSLTSETIRNSRIKIKAT